MTRKPLSKPPRRTRMWIAVDATGHYYTSTLCGTRGETLARASHAFVPDDRRPIRTIRVEIVPLAPHIKPKTWKVWAFVNADGRMGHVREADYREPASTLKGLGYVPAMLTIDDPLTPPRPSQRKKKATP